MKNTSPVSPFALRWPLALVPALVVMISLPGEEGAVVPPPPPSSDAEASSDQPELEPPLGLPDVQGRSTIAPEHSTLGERRHSLAAARAAARRSSADDATAADSFVSLAADDNPWQYDARLSLGGGYDSNPRRRGEVVNEDTDRGGVLKADGLLRGAWVGERSRLTLALSGAYDRVPAHSDAGVSHLGLTAGGRYLWQEGQAASMLTGTVDSRRWYTGSDGLAWSHSGVVAYSVVRPSFVHTVSLTGMYVRYDDNDADDGTGAWLGWRTWWMPVAGQPIPRVEVQGRLGRWSAEDDYWSMGMSVAGLWRSRPGEPSPGTYDVEIGFGAEQRLWDDTPNQTLFDARAEAGRWFTDWLKVAAYVRWNGSDRDIESDDYSRLQVGSMLVASF